MEGATLNTNLTLKMVLEYFLSMGYGESSYLVPVYMYILASILLLNAIDGQCTYFG